MRYKMSTVYPGTPSSYLKNRQLIKGNKAHAQMSVYLDLNYTFKQN